MLVVTVTAQNSRLNELEKKRKAALQRIEVTSHQLDKNKATAKNTLYKLNVLNDQIKVREQYIGSLDGELTKLDKGIEELKSEYEEMSRQLSVKKEQYARSLRLMARRNKSEDRLMFILSSKDLNQLNRRMRYLSEYAEYQKIQAIEITNKQTDLKEKSLELQQAYKEKEAVKDKQVAETNQLNKEKTQKSDLINHLKKEEKTLSADIRKQKRLADQLNRQIDNIIAEEARKAAAAAAKEKNRSKPETKGGYAMTEQEKSLSGDFGRLQGRLPYPVSSPGTIVVHFGEQKYQDLKYVQNSSKGIDIQTRPGTSALAVYKGVVTKIFVLPGFNSSVIVRHGNYLSVYANLVSLTVKVGDKVRTGEPIGKIYVDADQNNQTILHFQLFKDTQRLNPELWLHK
ncbi:MAG: peptidoglycan DD-metalloendopeptidase family protein [Bacteroidota bacterium]|nr:peptidoglycan DD-metalloendopeptidase family protein [Bacteroidota bacterium]